MADHNKCVFILSNDEDWSNVSRDIIIGDGCIGRAVTSTTELMRLANEFQGEACVLVDCVEGNVNVPQLYELMLQADRAMPMALVIEEQQLEQTQQLAQRFSCLVLLKQAGAARQRQVIRDAFGLRKLIDHQMAVRRNHDRLTELSERERAIVNMVVNGAPNKQIASKLGLSIKTIERVRQSAYRKLDVRSTAEMTRAVILGDLHDIVRTDLAPMPVHAPVVPAPLGLNHNMIGG